MHQLHEDTDYEEFSHEMSNLSASWKLPCPALPSSSTKNFDYYCSKSNQDIIVTRRRIFIPICDQFGASKAEFSQPGGGSHWSMLLWEVIARYYPKGYHVQLISTFSHFDSSSTYSHSSDSSSTDSHSDSSSYYLRGYNRDAAWRVAKKIRRALQFPEDDDGFDVWTEGDPDVMNVEECAVPKQNNGYDCGVFALGFAEAISSASMQQLYPDGKIDRATTKEAYEAVVRAHFEANGGSEAYTLRLRKQIGDDIRKLASSR